MYAAVTIAAIFGQVTANLRQMFGAVAAVLTVNLVSWSSALLSAASNAPAIGDIRSKVCAALTLIHGIAVQVVIAYVVSAYREQPSTAKLMNESKKTE